MRIFLIFVSIVFISACSVFRKADIYFTSLMANFTEVENWDGSSEGERLFTTDLSEKSHFAVLFITGSGCIGLKAHMPGYVRGLGSDYRVFAVEKPGVSPSDIGLNCSDTYYAENDFETRYMSNAKALEYILSAPQERYEKVIILGVSEGGTIASKLASEYSAVSNAVIIGSGGLPQILSLDILATKYGDPFDTELLERKVDESPQSHELVYGQTVGYWASYLYLQPAEFIAMAKMPVLVIMGENDRSEPIESLQYLISRVGQSDTVETWAVPEADHVLKVEGRDLKPEIFLAVDAWIRTGELYKDITEVN